MVCLNITLPTGKALANIRKFFYLVLIGTTLCFSVGAQNVLNVTSEQALFDEVKRIENDVETSPNEHVIYLEKLIQKADDNKWKKGKLVASVTALKFYKDLENIQALRSRLPALRVLAETLDDQTALIELDLIELFLLPNEGKNAQVFELHKKLVETADTLEDMSLAAQIYTSVGDSQYIVGKYNDAVANFEKAYQKFTLLNDEQGLSGVLTSLGNVNSNLGNIESSIDYYRKALDIAKASSDTFSESVLEYNLHFLFVMLEDYDQARTALENSIQLSEAIDDTVGIAFGQQRLADIHVIEQKWNEAIPLLEQTYLVFSETGNLPMVLQGLTSLAISYIQTTNVEGLRYTLDRFETHLTDSVETLHQINYQEAKAHWLYLTEDFKEAYELILRTKKLEESDNQKKQEEELEQLRVRFEVQLKDQENEKLQALNQSKQQTIEQQQQQKKFWIIVAVLSCLIFILLAFLLTLQVRNKRRFQNLAFIDQLTNTPNRRSIMKYAIQMIEGSQQKTQASVIIAILDLDNFKNINDTYGHGTGDNVLKAFANLLKDTVQASHKFGRFGGEEWLIVFTGNDTTAPQRTFEQIREKLKQTKVEGIPDSEKLSFSMGVAMHANSSKTTVDETIQIADQYLYQAKQQGRDQICGDARVVKAV
jgi:diguanylate cyclase (GGDEF)-like protein